MAVSSTDVRRLALPKFLLKEALRALQYPYGLATSLFHDALESFLHAVAVPLGVNIGLKTYLLDLLGEVGAEVPVVLQHKAAMRKLNAARVAFKHQGIAITKEDALVFAATAESFILDVTKDAMNVDFSTVSLADAIGHRRTQNWIDRGERELAGSDEAEALRSTAAALAIYMRHNDTQDEVLRRGWAMGTRRMFVPGGIRPNHAQDAGDEQLDQWRSEIGEFATWADDRIETMHRRLYLTTRGVDVALFDRFSMLAPKVFFDSAKFPVFQVPIEQPLVSAEDVRFCIDFAVDATRSNRPAKQVTGLDERAVVVRDCDIVVYPLAHDSEVIRRAERARRLICFPVRFYPWTSRTMLRCSKTATSHTSAAIALTYTSRKRAF